MLKAAVVGASGYAGGELLRLLAAHPDFVPAHAMAATSAGQPITALHPGLAEYHGRNFESVDIGLLNSCDLVFMALPHGQSAALVGDLTAKVVDLGADFRLASAKDWTEFYSGDHAGVWPYGLTEFARETISSSSRVANPGCYATAIALGILPIANAIEGSITVVATSGTTGAGRSSAPHLGASEVMGNMSAYKVGGIHQHTPEIEQSLRLFAGVEARISFTPFLAPMPRGILAAISAVTSLDAASLRARFVDRYASEHFVRVLDEGIQPMTSATLGTNCAHIQVVKDERTSRATITVALDNLVKGAAGQAIQNANLMFGLTEHSGLSVHAVRP